MSVHSDVVIDSTKMVLDKDYVKLVSEQLLNLTNFNIDYSDAHLPPESLDAFYNPVMIWDLWDQYLGSEERVEKFIKIVVEFYGVPAVSNVYENLKIIEECLFRKKGESLRERYLVAWHTAQSINLHFADSQVIADMAAKLHAQSIHLANIVEKLQIIEQSVIKREIKRILKAIMRLSPSKLQRVYKRLWGKLREVRKRFEERLKTM
jgi:hypothetical protein